MFEILVCPQCQQPLTYVKQRQELLCLHDRLAYPVVDGIPALLVTEARQLTDDE